MLLYCCCTAGQVGGKKLYESARKGKEVERQPRAVTGAAPLRMHTCTHAWPGGSAGWAGCCSHGLCAAAAAAVAGHVPLALPKHFPTARATPPHPPLLPPAVERFDVWRDAGEPQSVHFRVVCSKGTYVRTLAADLGRSLGSAAHLTALRREAIGEYSVEGAWEVTELAQQLHQHAGAAQRRQQQEGAAAAAVAAAVEGQQAATAPAAPAAAEVVAAE